MSKKTLSVKDIEKIKTPQLEKMSESELRNIASILASASNKRIRRIAQAGLVSPTVEERVNNIGVSSKVKLPTGETISINVFSSSKKNVPASKLIELINAEKDILRLKTGSVRGTREFYKTFEERTHGVDLSAMTREQVNSFFKLVNNAKELHGFDGRAYTSNTILETVEEVIQKNSSSTYEELYNMLFGKGGIHETEYKQRIDAQRAKSTSQTNDDWWLDV